MSIFKKILIIVGAIIILAIIIVLFFWLRGGATDVTPSSSDAGTSVIIQGAPSGLQAPTSTTIQIGTSQGVVTVNNFYKNVVAYEDQFLVLARSSDYEITYDTDRSAFFIQLSAMSLQGEGERAFLALLGVTSTNACKLSVNEGWPGSPSLASEQPNLSFCK
jgi:hypothetical protein